MHPIIPNTVGILAVALFLLSYQQKRRGGIIFCNTVSRILYIVQYLMLGAFEGAVLDILGAAASVVAGKKDAGFIGRHKRVIFLLTDAVIIAAGLLLYENVFSLLPIVGVLLHTGAFWLNDERIIRRISLAGSPFWFVYNLYSRAYGSAVGDVLTMLSILIAMLRYRGTVKKDPAEDAPATPEK